MPTGTVIGRGNLMDLSRPARAERAGVRPRWRTVFVYGCPRCGRETRINACSFLGGAAVPGTGAIRCPCKPDRDGRGRRAGG